MFDTLRRLPVDNEVGFWQRFSEETSYIAACAQLVYILFDFLVFQLQLFLQLFYLVILQSRFILEILFLVFKLYLCYLLQLLFLLVQINVVLSVQLPLL